MTKRGFFRAVLCRQGALRGALIAVGISGCGGSLSAPIDGGPTDGSTANACPSLADIDTNAAVGRACASEGSFCSNPACDTCTQECPAVSCVHGIWTSAINTALCISQPDAATSDASDGGACVTLDPSGYDTSCSVNTDCSEVTFGTFCANTPWCMCGGASINVDGRGRYDAALQHLRSTITAEPGGCSCPYLGALTCALGQCTLCGGAGGSEHHAGCPDAG